MWLKAFCKILTVTCFLSAVRPVIAIWPDKVYDFYILSGQQGVHWTKKRLTQKVSFFVYKDSI